MITTKNNMINILDRLMNGNVDTFYNIIGGNYGNFLLFYDIFKTMGDITFSNILYNMDSDGFEVELTSRDRDIEIIINTINSYDTTGYNVSCREIEGGKVIVNIIIGGE